jgi:hypothetical protein
MVRVWELPPALPDRAWLDPRDRLLREINRDGTVLVREDTSKSGFFGARYRFHDARTDAPLGQPFTHGGMFSFPDDHWVFSPDGTLLLTAHKGVPMATLLFQKPKTDGPDNLMQQLDKVLKCQLRLWRVPSGESFGPTMQFALGMSDHPAVAVSPGGRRVLASGARQQAFLFDGATGQPVGPPLAHRDLAAYAAFSADGKVAVTGTATETYLWDAATGKALGPPLPGWFLAIRADGRRLLTALSEQRVAVLYDTATGEPLGKSLRHADLIAAGAFSPDGTLVATGSQDQTARLWEADTGRPRGEPLRHPSGVYTVVFGDDGRTLLTAGGYGARLWDAATGKALGNPLHAEGVSWNPRTRGQARFDTAGTGVVVQTPQWWGVWPVPQPVDEPVERLRLWVETATGLELDAGGAVVELDAAAWERRWRRLQELGGPPR